MRDAAFEASGRALSAALLRSSCSGTEPHPRQARLRTAAAPETAATRGTTATDLGEISLGEIKIGLGGSSLGDIKIDQGDNSRACLESKIMPLGEVSLQETTATTLAAMLSTTWTTPLHGFEMLGR